MIKTQIQLPDALYRELKRVAREREMSMAEVLRRGGEYILRVYPPIEPGRKDERLPGPFNTGVMGDPFADPAWRYVLNERSPATQAVAREPRKHGYGKRNRKK